MRKTIAVLAVLAAMVVTAGAGWVAAPTNWITGYTSDGTNVTIPISTLTGLAAGDASASTGDVRKVMYAMTDVFYSTFAAAASTNQPAKIIISRQGTEVQGTNLLRRVYSIVVDLVVTNLQVVSE